MGEDEWKETNPTLQFLLDCLQSSSNKVIFPLLTTQTTEAAWFEITQMLKVLGFEFLHPIAKGQWISHWRS